MGGLRPLEGGAVRLMGGLCYHQEFRKCDPPKLPTDLQSCKEEISENGVFKEKKNLFRATIKIKMLV